MVHRTAGLAYLMTMRLETRVMDNHCAKEAPL